MSVLIKTMTNLPEHCYDCPCHDGESSYCQVDKEHRYCIDRPLWCPLVKISDKYKWHWIPVSERLPKANEYACDVAKYYLVQNEYGDMLVARYTHSEYWEQIYQLKPYADKIVAWMPLPEQYKPQESDKSMGEESIPYLMHKEMGVPLSECQKAYDVAIEYLRSKAKAKG